MSALNAKNAQRVESILTRATSSARAFASIPDCASLDVVRDVLAECRFFVCGMADTTGESVRHAYRMRLLNFLGDMQGDVSRDSYAGLWDCLDEAGVSRAEARGLGEAP